jgi:hypothetical protein
MGYAASDEVGDPDFVPLAERLRYYESRDGLKGSDEKGIEQDSVDRSAGSIDPDKLN